MSGLIKIAGLDPSMRNFGMVKGTLDLKDNVPDLTDLLLVETKVSKDKKTIRKNSDDLARAQKLYTKMHEFISDADMVFIEIPVGSQSARSMASYGVCIGLIGCITKPLIQVTPTEVKKYATGNANATKKQMTDWAIKRYPNLPWLTKTQKGQTSYVGKNEHLADAIGAIHAGIQTDQFKQLAVMLASIKSPYG